MLSRSGRLVPGDGLPRGQGQIAGSPRAHPAKPISRGNANAGGTRRHRQSAPRKPRWSREQIRTARRLAPLVPPAPTTRAATPARLSHSDRQRQFLAAGPNATSPATPLASASRCSASPFTTPCAPAHEVEPRTAQDAKQPLPSRSYEASSANLGDLTGWFIPCAAGRFSCTVSRRHQSRRFLRKRHWLRRRHLPHRFQLVLIRPRWRQDLSEWKLFRKLIVASVGNYNEAAPRVRGQNPSHWNAGFPRGTHHATH